MAEIIRKKAIDYFRAVWVEPQSETLESLLRSALEKFSTPADSIIDCEDGAYEATLHSDPSGSRLRLHSVRFQPGEEIAVVPALEKIREGKFDLATQSAYPGQEFLDAEIMVRVSDDHCLIMTYQARLGRVQSMLRHLLIKAGFENESSAFKLMPVPKPEFRDLLGEPVKSIGFNLASSYAARIAASQRPAARP